MTDLTPRDRVVLMALMSLNQEVTNAQLREQAGLTLEGGARRRLNDSGLVTSTMVSRRYVHELSDKGWAWCWDEMPAPPPAGADSGTRGLYAVLRGLRRYLDSSNLKLADVFGVVEDSLEMRLRTAYRDLAVHRDGWVSLTRVRALLHGVPRVEVDALLAELDAGPEMDLVPQTDQAQLTAADREAAIRIGGKDKHLLRFGRA